jgi:hypothetical protein
MQPRVETELSAPMLECIENCEDCHNICLETLQHCLQEGGEHADQSHIRLLMDCAQICTTSADFMLRSSPLHGRTCGVCAQVCEQCAESCAKFTGDQIMQECADTCQSCSDSCRKMSSMM